MSAARVVSRESLLVPPLAVALPEAPQRLGKKRKDKKTKQQTRQEKFTFFSDHNGSLPRQQPRAHRGWVRSQQPITLTGGQTAAMELSDRVANM